MAHDDDQPHTPPDVADGLDAPPARMEEPATTRAAKLCLTVPTGEEWAKVAVAHLPEVLLDHAWCEKKASATGMAFISRYPEDPELVGHMIDLAKEEWGHFERVYGILQERGIPFRREERDPYVNDLMSITRSQEPERYLDRLLCAAFIEARSCERFALLADALPPEEGELRSLYRHLFTAEARHYTLFVNLAYRRVKRDVVRARLTEISAHESDIIRRLPLAPRMH